MVLFAITYCSDVSFGYFDVTSEKWPICGMTSDFRPICGIGPFVGIGLVVGPSLVVSLTFIFQALCFSRPRYQVSVYRTIGPLVYLMLIVCVLSYFVKKE